MSTRRALALSFADRYAGLLLAIVSSVVIARLLAPVEIGAFSVVMVLVSLVAALRDFGAGQYLLQEKELTPQRITATWTVLLLTGCFFACVTAAAAWPISRFYSDERIVDIMLVLALSFVINPVGSLSYAWLMRGMRFDALALMRLGAGISGALTSVGLAWVGYGPVSLALGVLASTIANALIALAWRPKDFSWRPSVQEARRVVAFGSRISATAFVNNLGQGLPELLLGRTHGLAEAAFYSRAWGLAGMFQKLVLDAAQSVAAPLFAGNVRERGQVGPAFGQAMAYTCALGWSFFANLALLAQPVIRVLYGEQWTDAAEVTRWLAVAAGLALPASLLPIALNAQGAVQVTMRTAMAAVGLHVVLVAACAPFGLRATGAAIVTSQLAALALWWRAATPHLSEELHGGMGLLLPSAAAAVASTVPTLLVVLALGWQPEAPWTALALAIAGGVPALAAAAFMLRHPLRREIETTLLRLAAWRRRA